MLKKFLLLFSIGMPGVNKIVLAFFIERVFNIELLGIYSNDLNISMILTTLSGVGFATLMMSRIPTISQKEKRSDTFSYLLYSGIIISILTVPVIIVLNYAGIVVELFSVITFTTGMTAYIIVRQYYYTIKKYEIALIMEFGYLSLSLLLIYLYRSEPPLLTQGFILFILVIVAGFSNLRIIRKVDFATVKKGLEFGFSNLTSTFLGLISIPLALQMLGSNYAGFLGLINPVVALIILFPRSLGTYYGPDMAKNERFSKNQRLILTEFFKNNILLLFVLSSALFVSWYGFILLFPDSYLVLNNSTLIVSLVILNVFTSQASLPFFVTINVWEKSILSLKINTSTLIAFVILFVFAYLLSMRGIDFFVYILTVIILLNSIRFIFVFKYTKRILN